MFAKKVEDLIIYQISLKLTKEIYELTDKIPHYWQHKDVDQVRRSSSSVPSNISEGFGQRFYEKKYLHYLNIAIGSSDETQNHLQLLFIKNLITEQQKNDYLRRYKNLSVRILNLINYQKKKHDILI